MDKWVAINLAIIAVIGFLLPVAASLLNFPLSIREKRTLLSAICFLSLILMLYQLKSGINQYYDSINTSAIIDDQILKISELIKSEDRFQKDLKKLSGRIESLDSNIDLKIKPLDDLIKKAEKDIGDIMPYLAVIKNSIPIMNSNINLIPKNTAKIIQQLNKPPVISVQPTFGPQDQLNAEKLGIQVAPKPNM